MVSAHGIGILLPLTIAFLLATSAVHAAAEEPFPHPHPQSEEEMVPLIEEEEGEVGKMEILLLNHTTTSTGTSRRKLGGSFQICAVCTCCGGARGVCLPSPCCYAINCNIPNRPFGFCSFTPKTCNCFGCHV